jgi:hypothetical protein
MFPGRWFTCYVCVNIITGLRLSGIIRDVPLCSWCIVNYTMLFRSLIGLDALIVSGILLGRMSAPTVHLLQIFGGLGIEGATSSDSEGHMAVLKETDEEAPYGQRYSFSLKRGSTASVEDANSRKKPTQASTPVKRSDVVKATKSCGQAPRKATGRRHESRKGDTESKIIESIEENGKVVTRSRLKNT